MLDHTELREHIVLFSRKLKREGVRISQADTLVAIDALMHIDLLDKYVFYHTLRTVFCFSPEDYRRFERVFKGYWEYSPTPAGEEHLLNDAESSQEENDESASGSITDSAKQELEINHVQPMLEQLANLMGGKNNSLSKIGSYSVDEQLLIKRFMADPLYKHDQQDPELAILLYLLKKSLAKDKDTTGTRALHFRKTIRKNIQYGGEEIFRLHKYGRTEKNKQLLITLADISGSMDSFLKRYLFLLHQLHRYAPHSDVFFFNTDIYQVTKYFKREYFQTLELLNEQLRLTSKGTNLAKSIMYLRQHAAHSLSKEYTTILIFSDGWDRGDMDELTGELAWLSKQVHQIIWLNPLLGSKGYEPITQALEIAKPYIDYLVSDKQYQTIYKQLN